MNQHDFNELFQSQQLLSLNSKIASLQSATHAAEARRAQEKAAKDRVFAAFEEFQLIQKNLHKFPLWAALRLIALHHDLQGHLSYSALETLEPHVATDDGQFPFSAATFGPLEQTDLEALEYKALLSKLKTGIPEALDEVLNGHAEVKSETLTGVIGCLGAAKLAELEGHACNQDAEPMFTNPVGTIIAGSLLLGIFWALASMTEMLWLLFVAIAGIVAGILFLRRRSAHKRAEAKKAYDGWITTGAQKLKEAISIVNGGPSSSPAMAPQRQLPASAVTVAQAPKPRRTEPTALCSNCQQKIVFPIEMAGQTASCPSCGTSTTLDDVSDVLS